MADYNMVYRAVLSVTVGASDVTHAGNGLFYKDFAMPSAVKLGSAIIHAQPRYRRIGDEYGATVVFQDDETLRMSWYGDPAQPAGLVLDEATGLNEIIDVAVEVLDLEELGDDLKEILFRAARALGYLGENVMQDKLEYDQAGNLTQYRLRLFDTRDHLEDATPDLPDGDDMETGETARVTMNQDIVMDKNDRALLTRVLTDVIETPGIDPEEEA